MIYRVRKALRAKAGYPCEIITPLICILKEVCVHYALFEDEFHMKTQIETLKEALELFAMKYNQKARSGSAVMTEISAERNLIKTAELTV